MNEEFPIIVEDIEKFGGFFKSTRRKSGQVLRLFCKDNNFDATTISLVERNKIPPYNSDLTLEAYTEALNIEKNSNDYIKFFRLAKEANDNFENKKALATYYETRLDILYFRNELSIRETKLSKIMDKLEGEDNWKKKIEKIM